MKTLNNLNDKSFVLNDKIYSKHFELRQGVGDTFSLISIYDRTNILFTDVKLEDIYIEDEVFDTAFELMMAFEDLKFSSEGSEGSEGSSENYSLDEQVIGKWIDDKPIYRKVIAIPTSPSNAQTITHNLGIKRYLKTDFYISESWMGSDIPPVLNTTNAYLILLTPDDNSMEFEVVTSGICDFVTLEYTKTTD